ncbi:MAG: hypothetical protein HC913_08765 [Microscillaceae bacterium]|nr:hypothetical protein [Microscillaceae bacterium]
MNPIPAQVLENVSQISMKLMIGDRSQGIESEPFFGHFFTGMVKKLPPKPKRWPLGATITWCC